QEMPLRCRIGDDAIASNDGGLRELSRLRLALSHDVDHRFARSEKVISDDPAMAAPPHRLGAHDGASLRLAEAAEFQEAGVKSRRRRVVGVIAEILVLPKAVRRRAL